MSFVNMRVFGAVLVLAGCAIADDWPQWRGPNRDGISTEQGLLATWPENGPAMLWQVDLPGDAYASPAVAGNSVFVTGSIGGKPDRTGFLCALDPKTGAVRWQTSYGPEWGSSYESARTTPTVVKDRIYIISGMGRVACMETKAGKLVWQVDLMERFKGRNIGWGIAESPLVYDNKIICHPGGPDAAVAALDAGSGATIWQSKGLSDKSAYCSPALLNVDGRKQLVTQTENSVVGLDPESGAVLWKYAHRNKYAVHPNTPLVFDGNKVFVASGYNYGAEALAIKGAAVDPLWRCQQAECHFQGFMLVGSRIFCPGGGSINCLNTQTGTVVYRVKEVKKPQVTMTASGLIAYDENGRVWLLDMQADSYTVKGSLKVDFGSGQHWSTPAVANGAMYLRHGKTLAAYNLRATH
ncbi:MAG: PQQ-binding-like beta-propeller repeat protein [bacterium]